MNKIAVPMMLVAVALAACGGPRPINPGAKVLIYVEPVAELQAQAPMLDHPGGFTRWENGKPVSVWLPSDTGHADLIRVTIHELLKHCSDVPLEDFGTDRMDFFTCAGVR